MKANEQGIRVGVVWRGMFTEPTAFGGLSQRLHSSYAASQPKGKTNLALHWVFQLQHRAENDLAFDQGVYYPHCGILLSRQSESREIRHQRGPLQLWQ